jgi:hypothetical protein
MAILSTIRRFAFLVILAGALVPATVHGEDPICPVERCDYCPASWFGSCWDPTGDCQEYGCRGSFGPCDLNGQTMQVCVCPPCMD